MATWIINPYLWSAIAGGLVVYVGFRGAAFLDQLGAMLPKANLPETVAEAKARAAAAAPVATSVTAGDKVLITIVTEFKTP